MPAETSVSLSCPPRREDLLRRIEAANRWGAPIALFQLVAIVVLGFLIDWNEAIAEPFVTTVAIGAIVGPFAMGLLRFWVAKKKRIDDLQEQTRFGEFDKHSLASLYQDTLRRLGLPDDRLPVFIVADKSLNAMMMHVGMGSFLRGMNGIYLHRQVLHKLNANEVQDIIGHELGHYYKHYIYTDRYRGLTLILGAMTGLYVAQLLGAEGFITMIALVACSQGLWWLSGMQHARHAMAIEYLCDDLGAQVHGVEASISGLMKLGAEAEVLTAVQQQAVFSANRGNLSAREIVEAIEAAIPYGHASKEELQAAVEKQLKRRSQQGASVGGFLHYMWNSDVDAEITEEFEKEMRKLKALQKIPRLDWEALLDNPQQLQFSERSLGLLVDMIETQPQGVLFHTAEALGESDGMHPPLKLRILYLWHNRKAIEGARVCRDAPLSRL